MPEPPEPEPPVPEADLARILLGGVSFAAPFHNFGLSGKNDEFRACSYVQYRCLEAVQSSSRPDKT